MKQLKARISENKKMATGFYKMRIQSPYFAKNTKPGQFFKVRCSDSNEPLLRRPLGAHRILKDSVEILYEVVGIGTQLLSKKKKGEYLDIIGPLGNGFILQRSTIHDPLSTILIAGGIGVAPLFALAESLIKNKNKVTVIIGARSKSYLMCEKEFKEFGCDVKIATEDGSKGHKGLATDLLRNTPSLSAGRRAARSMIYACGPTAMLKVVANIAEDKKMPCQVSLDERMACGVGVCLGCPVKVRGSWNVNRGSSKKYEYKMVCKDGPVFDAKELIW